MSELMDAFKNEKAQRAAFATKQARLAAEHEKESRRIRQEFIGFVRAHNVGQVALFQQGRTVTRSFNYLGNGWPIAYETGERPYIIKYMVILENTDTFKGCTPATEWEADKMNVSSSMITPSFEEKSLRPFLLELDQQLLFDAMTKVEQGEPLWES